MKAQKETEWITIDGGWQCAMGHLGGHRLEHICEPNQPPVKAVPVDAIIEPWSDRVMFVRGWLGCPRCGARIHTKEFYDMEYAG